MSSQQSNGRRPNRRVCHISFHWHALRVNAQRTANWFKKPSLPRFKLKFPSSQRPRSSASSPYSSTDDNTSQSIKTSSSVTLHSIPPQRLSYNARMMMSTSQVIVPVMPTVRRSFIVFSFFLADHYSSFQFWI